MPTFTGTGASELIEGTDQDDEIWGEGGDDQILGYGGRDRLHGGVGNDAIHGGDGDDQIWGDAGDDLIAGGAGADIIHGGDGADGILFDTGDRVFGDAGNDYFEADPFMGGLDIHIDGGSGDDILNLRPFTGAVTLALGDAGFAGPALRITSVETIWFGSGGTTTVHGSSGADTLMGSVNVGALHLYGGAGNDRLGGWNSADIIHGEAGDDIILGTGGADDLDGGDGRDILDFSEMPVFVTLDLGNADWQQTPMGLLRVRNFEEVRGSTGGDTLRAGVASMTLRGGAGDDILEGGAGNDVLDGGEGRDTLSYAHAQAGVTVHLGQGSTTNAGLGHDIFAGFENIVGSAFDDELHGDAGDNILRGGLGSDLISGGEGYDVAVYEGSDYEASYDGVTVTVRIRDGSPFGPGEGVDRLVGVEEIRFGANAPILVANLGVVRRGDEGADELLGTANNDYLYGGGGDDRLEGRGGSQDSLHGEGGNDTLVGGDGNDLLYGGDGDDVLDAAGGLNLIEGGAGDDSIFVHGDGYDNVVGGDGFDTIYYDGPGRFFMTETKGERLVLTGSADSGAMVASGYVGGLVQGNSGANRIEGGFGNDDLSGGAGDDTLVAGGGYDTLRGEGGDDVLDGRGASSQMHGGDGDDVMEGGSSSDLLDGGAGYDWASWEHNFLSGVIANLETGRAEEWGGAIDTLVAVEALRGSDFADHLTGDDSDNRLEGGAGDDRLSGGTGDDVLTGGAGSDALAGGGGWDEAVFDGKALDYTVVRHGDGYRVKGPDGTDYLTGVESLRFDDGVVDLTLVVCDPSTGAVSIGVFLSPSPDPAVPPAKTDDLVVCPVFETDHSGEGPGLQLPSQDASGLQPGGLGVPSQSDSDSSVLDRWVATGAARVLEARAEATDTFEGRDPHGLGWRGRDGRLDWAGGDAAVPLSPEVGPVEAELARMPEVGVTSLIQPAQTDWIW